MSWAWRIEDCVDPSDWAYVTCEVYSCGYSQPCRTDISEAQLRDGTAETDCSAGVSWWLYKGGLLDECPWFSTHWEREYLQGEGYTQYAAGDVEPERNDVLWRAGHTALYIGEGLQAEALRTERGDAGYSGSEPGDQDGGETVVREYDASSWTYILRPPVPCVAKWMQDAATGRWWYRHADGSWATGWEQIDGAWYLFDADGWMLTGWQHSGANWYYMGDDGAMVTGWRYIGSNWYWFDAQGAMACDGWRIIDDSWYHFNASGAMSRSTCVPAGGRWCAVASDGRCIMDDALKIDADGYIIFN